MARLLPRPHFNLLFLSALLLCTPLSQADTSTAASASTAAETPAATATATAKNTVAKTTTAPTTASTNKASTNKAAINKAQTKQSPSKHVGATKPTAKASAKTSNTNAKVVKTTPKRATKTPVAGATSAKAPLTKAPSSKVPSTKAAQPATAKSKVAKAKRKPSPSRAVAAAAAAASLAAAAKPTPVDPNQLDAYPKVAKAYLVKVDNQVLWEGAAERRLPPASLTKMMTALLVVESYRPNDVVEVSAAAAAETGSHIGLRAGDRLLLADVLAATMIRSANDACHALADWHSGSEAAFVVRMNQRAEQLGLRDTHFQNACGHDHPDHYSSAHDLSVIAETALKNSAFAHVVTKPRLAIRSVDGRRTFRFKSTNALIGHVDGVMGVKTGYTEGAGPCLVALAERDNVRVMLVLLNAHNRWPNATTMIDNAFAQMPRMGVKKTPPQQAAIAPAPLPRGA